MPTPSPSFSCCPSCRAAVAADQRFCLHCGSRVGVPSVDYARELGLLDDPPAMPAAAIAPTPGPRRAGRIAAAALTLGVGLAAGAGLGNAPASPQAAVPRRALAVVVPAAAAPAAATKTQADVPAERVTTPDPDGADPASTSDTEPAPAAAPAQSTDPSDGGSPTPSPTPAPTPAPAAGPVHHAWVIALRGHAATETFAPDGPAPRLAALAARGVALTAYTPTDGDPAHSSSAWLSGVAPTHASDPKAATLLRQLADSGRTTRAYFQQTGAGCHDAVVCAADLAPLSQLVDDLKRPVADVPALNLIVPDPCHDGSAETCDDGSAGGLAGADAFADLAVAAISSSAAFGDAGLIAIVFDSGPPSGDGAAPAATGAVLLGPGTAPGRAIANPAGPYGLLRTLEDGFGLPPLGHAADATPFPLPTMTPTTTRRSP